MWLAARYFVLVVQSAVYADALAALVLLCIGRDVGYRLSGVNHSYPRVLSPSFFTIPY